MQSNAINVSRRQLVKSGIAATTALSVGIPITSAAAKQPRTPTLALSGRRVSAVSAVLVAACKSVR